jgi:hypothetical protein
MRSLPSATYRASVHDRDRTSATVSLIAFFSAFALIAAITFGMTSVHPF